jgi:1-acyl-sn-glycerol-3-phosphate acyltransferase
VKRSPLVDILLRPFVYVSAMLLFRLKTVNKGIIPKKGGIIIAGNHISDWDPPFVGAAIPRGVHFMAKSELFATPLSAFLLSALGAFPVYRQASVNSDALRTAAQVIKDGKALVIFPEGTRSKTGKMLPAKAGVGYIAHAAGVPVFPFYISGTDHPLGALFFKTRFSVTFGDPITPEKMKELHDTGGPGRCADYILEKVKEIRDRNKMKGTL